MKSFLIDNIFAVRRELFSTIHRKPYGNKLCPLITNLFLYSYEAEFMQNLIKDKTNEFKAFNLTFRYIDDVLSVNNQSFANGIPLI